MPKRDEQQDAVIEYVHRAVDDEFWLDVRANGELSMRFGPTTPPAACLCQTCEGDWCGEHAHKDEA
jgi:hypothetical protein